VQLIAHDSGMLTNEANFILLLECKFFITEYVRSNTRLLGLEAIRAKYGNVVLEAEYKLLSYFRMKLFFCVDS
jgi:hypothetical protein